MKEQPIIEVSAVAPDGSTLNIWLYANGHKQIASTPEKWQVTIVDRLPRGSDV